MLCANLIGGSPIAAEPQSGSGVVTGVVLGADNKPVPNAVITYQNAGGRAPHVAHADAHGHFTVSKLKGDVYEFRAASNGVSSDWENIAVHPGKSHPKSRCTRFNEKTVTAHTRRRTPTNSKTRIRRRALFVKVEADGIEGRHCCAPACPVANFKHGPVFLRLLSIVPSLRNQFLKLDQIRRADIRDRREFHPAFSPIDPVITKL